MTARNRRLRRGLAWPVTNGDFSEVLGPLLAEIRDLRFLTTAGGGQFTLAVEWVAAEPFNYGRGVHPDAVGFRIDVSPVDAGERAMTRAALRAQALPELRDWITRALDADEVWKQARHSYYWRFADGRLTGSSALDTLTGG